MKMADLIVKYSFTKRPDGTYAVEPEPKTRYAKREAAKQYEQFISGYWVKDEAGRAVAYKFYTDEQRAQLGLPGRGSVLGGRAGSSSAVSVKVDAG